MSLSINDVLQGLPDEYPESLLPKIRASFLASGKTLVVFDDDPTGTQTCHDVTVLTSWNTELVRNELEASPSILFILTNSRSLTEDAAVGVTSDAARHVLEASSQTGRSITALSRSDSTLRGHFPAEVNALAAATGMTDAVRLLIPAFIEGGRLTINDVHYLKEGDQLLPVSESPFARDKSFGYTTSNLREWIQEKSKGAISPEKITSVSIKCIREQGPEGVEQVLSKSRPGDWCIINACSFRDLEVVALAVSRLEEQGRSFIFRSSATFVSIRTGIAPGHIVKPSHEEWLKDRGSLIVVGSYVPKTTGQLNELLKTGITSLKIDVGELVNEADAESKATALASIIDSYIVAGEDVAVYTSRGLVSGSTAEESLRINALVSGYLVRMVNSLQARPSFVVAKGGITSSDLASKALEAKRADVLGQAIPGVPVWRLSSDSKFPYLLYIVFPGNVGDERALTTVWETFRNEIRK